MYADDTTIYFNLEDFPVHNRHIEINRELDKVNTWLKVNKLSINVEKTKCMLFHKRRQLNPIQLLPILMTQEVIWIGLFETRR